MDVVLDTGSQGSAVSEKFMIRYVESGLYPSRTVSSPRGADDAPLLCDMKITLPVLFGDLAMQVGFYVVKNLAVDILIGQDVLMQANLQQADKALMFKNYNVSLPISYRYLQDVKDQRVQVEESVLCITFGDTHVDDMFIEDLQNEGDTAIIGLVTPADPTQDQILAGLDEELNQITQARLKILDQETDIPDAIRSKRRDHIMSQAAKLRALAHQYPNLFTKSFQAGTLKVPPVSLEFKRDNVKPIVSKLRPLAHAELKIVEQWIRECMEKGVIEESNSMWRSTVFPVPKPDGVSSTGEKVKRYRVVTPFYGLNRLLNLRATPLPHILDVQVALAGANYFTTLDLKESFFQIPLDVDSRPYTAFAATGTRLYQYRVIPMGCSISTAVLQSAITRILGEDYFKTCIAYADDIIIFSRGSEADHRAIADRVFRKLNEAGAQVNLSKVSIALEEVDFLGMTVSSKGWKLSDKYKKAIQQAEKPTDLKSLRSFLGLANWQRRFIPNYSQVAKPLTDLTQKQVTSVQAAWGKAQDEAFHKLKAALSSNCILGHPDFNKPFYLYSDASDEAIGSCLCQQDNNGKMQIIGYSSRKFLPSEMSKGVPEKEMMALVEGLEDFRPFVLGYKTVCYVDQRSLKWLLEKNHPSRYTRYRERLDIFDYEVKHIEGKKNIADWISRYAYMGFISNTDIDDSQWISALRKDPFWRKLKEISETNGSHSPEFKWGRFTYNTKHFSDIDGLCRYQGRLLIPEELIHALLKKIHDEDHFSSHQGSTRTTHLVARRYYWPTWKTDVKNYVLGCDRCQRNKKGRLVTVPRTQLEIPHRKFGTISIDIWGYGALPQDREYLAVLTVIDRLTNYVQFLPIRSRDMEETLSVLSRGWFSKYGFPDNIHADNEFNNGWIEQYCDYFNVSRSFTAFYAPFQNGQVERVHRFLGEQIAMLGNDQVNWSDYIDYIAAKYNAGWCASCNEAPHYLVYGQDFKMTSDEDMETLRRIGTHFTELQRLKTVEENVKLYREERFAKNLQKFMQNHPGEGYTFCPGDIVWWFTHPTRSRVSKFDGAQGPYRIMKILGDNLVELDRVDGKNHQYIRAATSQLRLCTSEDADI